MKPIKNISLLSLAAIVTFNLFPPAHFRKGECKYKNTVKNSQQISKEKEKAA